MDLIGGYLLIILILFATNIGLFLGNYKIDNAKLIILSAMSFIVSFILMYASGFLKGTFSFLMDYFAYVLFIIFIVIVVSIWTYVKNDNLKLAFHLILMVSVVSTVLFASQSNLDIFSIILYSLFVFIMLFVVYQLSKLLHHAKRQYPVIIGEYMCLFSILMFILALTYDSTRALDYTAFSPFLILTPTYQLIYVIMGVIVVLVAGVLINDKGGNS